MVPKHEAYRGCLLGLAVGDALGYTIDNKCWEHIQQCYGPGGLKGYDLVNGYADITSHTQLAAFTANGLLLGMTRGQIRGVMAPFIRYIEIAHWEWAAGQRRYDQPKRIFCWVFHSEEMRRRRCTDTRMLDTLNRQRPSSLETPSTRYDGPGSLSAAVAVGLFAGNRQMSQRETDHLGAEAVALTFGCPDAFLAGAVVTHLISHSLQEPDKDLRLLVQDAMEALKKQFSSQYPQSTAEVCCWLRQALTLAENDNLTQVQAMEHLQCLTAAQTVAGAIYACLTCRDNFDSAMITAVNHSGRSAAVGCLAGAILGLKMGDRALPDFYLECLEPTEMLRELADDLAQGCPMIKGHRLFDGDWETKYLNGSH